MVGSLKSKTYINRTESIEDAEMTYALPALLEMKSSGESLSDKDLRKLFKDRYFAYEVRMDLDEYYVEIYPLQVEMVKMQNWVKATGQKIVIIFEGRDAAGKGSTIRTLTQHLNPRGAKVIALDKPTEVERHQWYFQRYVDHLPSAGEIVFFDRSWYNRAGVERVMGFCTEEEYWEFIDQVPSFERMLVKSKIHMIKIYLSIGKEEQARRFEERATNPLKQWKLSPVDIEAQAKWDDYTKAKEDTFKLTHSEYAPWTIIKAEDRLRARLNTMRNVLSAIQYTGKSNQLIMSPDPLIVASAARIFGPAE